MKIVVYIHYDIAAVCVNKTTFEVKKKKNLEIQRPMVLAVIAKSCNIKTHRE